MGTGLAQAKKIGDPVIRRTRGRRIVPKRSAWARGFRVRRPWARGVGSPKRSAIRA